ncbi:Cupin 2, conserved barrel domain protein (plasmid) [Sinorhizobium sojae CCBAU 05684]|uniref:Cupin 2, conserved barrel domain protein n=1 Tax=Sinorhizobium sojae CCBAU 05684 TaxID=716928 RepID=A0A249PLB7_9HYPH|nr:cupin domain-containing protein [Sinorhizobium sojae]ASY66484.1 Cupin 2, conserved barrel domain protein [Sinorhizobium sojae CCBAU 05684]
MSVDKQTDVPRRVVTGIRNGRSVFISDGEVPNAHLHASVPGFVTSVCWATAPEPKLPLDESDPALPGIAITPSVGETRLMIVRFPPDSVMADPSFDPAAAAVEQQVQLPGLAELFERENPGMHTTDSIDYDIVLEGEIWLELDDGAEVHLRQGDIAIQCGTRHAWRNKGTLPATMAFVLIGAARS